MLNLSSDEMEALVEHREKLDAELEQLRENRMELEAEIEGIHLWKMQSVIKSSAPEA